MQYIKENGTKIFFMIGVFSFLAVSIPHVGAIFRMYEPIAQGPLDAMWNICSFAAAAGIDVLAGWLTLVMMNKEARGRDKVIIWTFIIALMVFSWYCNWLFDELHSPHPINVWAITIISLPWIGSWTVDQLTPLIVSALPVFIVAYASIAHLVGVKQNVAVISLADLQQKAAEAQARAQAEVAIIQAQNMVNENKVSTAIDLGKTLWNKATNNGKKEAPKTDETRGLIADKDTDKIPVVKGEDNTPKAEDNSDENADKAEQINSRSKPITGPLSMSVKEAALMLGLSETRVRELKNKKVLHTTPRNNRLLITRSVKEYLKTRQNQEQKEDKEESKDEDKELAKELELVG